MDLPLLWSVRVNDLILAYLETRLDCRQSLSVDTLVLHRQATCEQVVRDAQVHAWFSDVLDGLRSKRLLALNFDLLLFLSIDIDFDISFFDIIKETVIDKSEICVLGMLVYDSETWLSKKTKLQSHYSS